jgi:hypothetical protein
MGSTGTFSPNKFKEGLSTERKYDSDRKSVIRRKKFVLHRT